MVENLSNHILSTFTYLPKTNGTSYTSYTFMQQQKSYGNPLDCNHCKMNKN